MNYSKRKLAHLLCVTLTTLVLVQTTLSAFELNRYFSVDMVLQRDKEITIWGTGKKDETVTVTFAPRQGSGQAGQTKSATTDESGRWVVTLAPIPASSNGLAIPGDLSILSASLIYRPYDPVPVAMIDQKTETIGDAAVELLFRQITSGRRARETIAISGEFIPNGGIREI